MVSAFGCRHIRSVERMHAHLVPCNCRCAPACRHLPRSLIRGAKRSRTRNSNSDAQFAGLLRAQRRRPQKNCNCYHRGGTWWTPRTASPAIQKRGCERKRPETSDRADRPDAGRVGAATSRDGKGNGLVRPMRRDVVPLVQQPHSTICRGRDRIGPFQLFPSNQFTPGFWMSCRSGSSGWSPDSPPR
jgi:hypothetical protein